MHQPTVARPRIPHRPPTEAPWIRRSQEQSRQCLPRYQECPDCRERSHQLRDLKSSQYRLLFHIMYLQCDQTSTGVIFQASITDERNTISPASQNRRNQELATIAYIRELASVNRMIMPGIHAILSVASLGTCCEIGAWTAHYQDPIRMAMNEHKQWRETA